MARPAGNGAAGGVLGYMPQLDGLRAIAVLLVMVTHFHLLKDISLLSGVGGLVGTVGVNLFFVLSGYLITGILLEGRDLVDAGHQPVGFTLRQFYIRRFLRIFPIYYAALFALGILGLEPVRENLFWFFTYLVNFKMFESQSWLYPVGHFWSLAVEEQFYLIWPWLIIAMPRRWLERLIFCLVGLASLGKLLLWVAGQPEIVIKVTVFTNLDFLAVGALLAVYRRDPERHAVGLARLLRWGLWIGGPMSVFCLVFAAATGTVYDGICGFWLAIFCAWLVDRAASGRRDALGRFLAFGPVVAMGKVSYGIYVYHRLVQWAAELGASQLGLPFPESPYVSFLLLFTLTLLVASVSWRLFEQPINGFKRLYPYRARKAVAASPAVGTVSSR